MKRLLEICCGDIASVRAARQGGADRVELCSALSEGGVTPSYGLIREARGVEGIKVHVLIRPRGGDFVYTPDEVAIMENDIEMCRLLGVDGVVIGALLPDGTVDMDTCSRLVKAAGTMSVTFHRAFDMVANGERALEDVIALGCHRILTSGLHLSALEGKESLRRFVELANGRIIIMPGAGVSPANASEILTYTGANEIHASARSTVNSEMEYRNPLVSMGGTGEDEYSRKETDATVVAAIVNVINA